MARPIELAPISTAESSRFLTEDPLPANLSATIAHDALGHTLTSEEYTLASIHPPWKRDLHALLEQPKSDSVGNGPDPSRGIDGGVVRSGNDTRGSLYDRVCGEMCGVEWNVD
ncbi:hypothetical protein DXG01_016800 [Tephrocybe rancida]|nr:hypothetical protein DXG01_016800 [Tephrocybe rancida]